MITKIVLENFMAHEHTELELSLGVNALTGPNNTGKSAIVEGLRCVATNPVPKHYIRHGAKEARVSVEIEDGTKVVWVRKKKSAGYELWKPGAEEPQEYWKFGRRPPEDVLDVLRLNLVELETGTEIDVHVGNQRHPIFLVDQPGSNAAAFFAASTESAHLLAMQNLLKRRTQDAKRNERDLKARLITTEDRLDEFHSLPDVFLQAENARELEATTKVLERDIPALEAHIAADESLSKKLEWSSETATSLKGLLSAPKLNDINEVQSLIARIKSVEVSLSTTGKRQAGFSSLASWPDVCDTKTLAQSGEAITWTQQALQKAEEISRASTHLEAPPQPENTSQLSVLLDQLHEVKFRSQRLSRWSDTLQAVVEPPDVLPLAPMESLLNEMQDLEQSKMRAQASFSELENQVKQLKIDIQARIESIGSCPTCGADLNGLNFLDRGCQHDA